MRIDPFDPFMLRHGAFEAVGPFDPFREVGLHGGELLTVADDGTGIELAAVIEIMFGRLKDWRRIATRYNRCTKVFLSAIALAAAVIFWL